MPTCEHTENIGIFLFAHREYSHVLTSYWSHTEMGGGACFKAMGTYRSHTARVCGAMFVIENFEPSSSWFYDCSVHLLEVPSRTTSPAGARSFSSRGSSRRLPPRAGSRADGHSYRGRPLSCSPASEGVRWT